MNLMLAWDPVNTLARHCVKKCYEVFFYKAQLVIRMETEVRQAGV